MMLWVYRTMLFKKYVPQSPNSAVHTHIYGSKQDCSISSVLAMEIPQSWLSHTYGTWYMAIVLHQVIDMFQKRYAGECSMNNRTAEAMTWYSGSWKSHTHCWDKGQSSWGFWFPMWLRNIILSHLICGSCIKYYQPGAPALHLLT